MIDWFTSEILLCQIYLKDFEGIERTSKAMRWVDGELYSDADFPC